MFIPILYMFRAPLCPSSGESIVSIWHLVYVTLCRWPSSVQVWISSKVGKIKNEVSPRIRLTSLASKQILLNADVTGYSMLSGFILYREMEVFNTPSYCLVKFPQAFHSWSSASNLYRTKMKKTWSYTASCTGKPRNLEFMYRQV
jgi:hypothetical protein